jgi:hypothetical protein
MLLQIGESAPELAAKAGSAVAAAASFFGGSASVLLEAAKEKIGV